MKRVLGGGLLAVIVILAAMHGRRAAPIAVESPGPPPVVVHRAARDVPPALVYVVGAVRRPGLYRVALPARAADAIAAAGGLSSSADPAGVNLAAFVADGDQVTVPAIGESAPLRRAPRVRHRNVKHARKHRAPEAALRPIDLNAATADDLQRIPGIGPALAQRIVAFRDANGRFASVDELADVAGMNERRLETAAAYLTVAN